MAGTNDPLHLFIRPPFPPHQRTVRTVVPGICHPVCMTQTFPTGRFHLSSILLTFVLPGKTTLAASAEPLESRRLISLDIFARLLFYPTAASTACLQPQCLADVFKTPKWLSRSDKILILFWQASYFCLGHTVPRKPFCQFSKLFLTFLICLGHVSTWFPI